MDTRPITARSFEDDYHIDGDEYGRAYKDHLSGYREWSELGHADEWLIFPENISPHVSIDETCLSTGEVYTIASNMDAHGRKGCLIAAAMYDREDEILNYFVNRSTNASAESLNAKIKHFRAQLRGIIDRKFFLFRLMKIYA